MTWETAFFWLQQVVGVALACALLVIAWRRRASWLDVWTGAVVAYLIASTAAAWMPKHDWNYSTYTFWQGPTSAHTYMFTYSNMTKADAERAAARLRRDQDNTDIQVWED